MRLKIKNAKSVHIDPATKAYCLGIVVNGVEVQELLENVDIIDAIDYYGVTELLDIIGKRQLKLHLECLNEDDGQEDNWLVGASADQKDIEEPEQLQLG
ncbi:hypothetical protein [Pedobacter sp. Hv1]|uniref:hypothetical protein n=1 Tax=Pedobacter sp. Hv1 TaxID=1740090 RepID=UPI0006D8D068|nr:hypothetical protein [Pedobacter sp. Hv1]KQB99838.1 hypothetical protein AQF98_15085 [Pedobacter sp. Hv1]